jgi:hypothetical protein
MIEEETKLEREQYLADLETERSASSVLRNEMEQLREAAIADDRDRRIQLLAVAQSCWAHARAESKEKLEQGRRDSDAALQEMQLRVMSHAADKDEDDDEYTAEMVAIFRAIRRHHERQQELALANLNAEHCNEMNLLHEARVADMVDLFHVCQKARQAEPSTSNEGSTQAPSTSHNVVDEPPKETILAEPKKEDVPSCQDSVGASAAVKEIDGGATDQVPTTQPQLSVQVGYVPVEQKSALQSPTSAFAPYRRTERETEARTEKPAVNDSSAAPLLEPSSKHQESSVEAQAVQPTVEASAKKPVKQAGAKLQQPVGVEALRGGGTLTPDGMSKTALLQPDPKQQNRPAKRESALRRPSSLAAPSSGSNLWAPVRTKSSVPGNEDNDSTRDKVKRKPALPKFSSPASTSSTIGKDSERASGSASALPSHTKRNEPNNTLTGLPSRKTATNRVESQIGGKKVSALPPPTSRPSRLQGETTKSDPLRRTLHYLERVQLQGHSPRGQAT